MPVSKEMKESQAVIIGTVMSSRQVPQSWDTLDGTEYVVHIDQKVKGKQTGEITIFSEHTDDAFFLQAGKQYLLFLTNNYHHWMVNMCGNSGPMDEASKVIRQMVHARATTKAQVRQSLTKRARAESQRENSRIWGTTKRCTADPSASPLPVTDIISH